MKITRRLKEDHETIRLMLRILDEMSRRLQSGADVNPEHLNDVVEFAEVFVNRSHQRREEDLILATTEEAGTRGHAGALAALLTEHATIRKHFGDLREAVAAYKAGDSKARFTIIASVRFYSSILAGHMDTSENDFYPRADLYLSKDREEELWHKFEEEEAIINKEDAREKLPSLKRVYLE